MRMMRPGLLTTPAMPPMQLLRHLGGQRLPDPRRLDRQVARLDPGQDVEAEDVVEVVVAQVLPAAVVRVGVGLHDEAGVANGSQ